MDATVSETVQDVLNRMLRPGETKRRWIDDDQGWIFRPADSFAETWLHVAAESDCFEFRLWTADPAYPDETDLELRARLVSDLQDWIAESTFAWGEWRSL